jgi:hypothetical protein
MRWALVSQPSAPQAGRPRARTTRCVAIDKDHSAGPPAPPEDRRSRVQSDVTVRFEIPGDVTEEALRSLLDECHRAAEVAVGRVLTERGYEHGDGSRREQVYQAFATAPPAGARRIRCRRYARAPQDQGLAPRRMRRGRSRRGHRRDGARASRDARSRRRRRDPRLPRPARSAGART